MVQTSNPYAATQSCLARSDAAICRIRPFLPVHDTSARGAAPFSPDLSPLVFLSYSPRASLIEGVVGRGVDDGARCGARQRHRGGAPGGAAAYVIGRAHPEAATPGNGDIAVGAIKRTLARSVREPRKLPGASRRSIPSLRGEGKQGCGPPRAQKTKNRGSGALAKMTTGSATAASCLRAALGSRLLPDRGRARAGGAIRR